MHSLYKTRLNRRSHDAVLLLCACGALQLPTQAPTALPVSISVLSPWHRPSANGSVLVNALDTLRLQGASATAPPSAQYNWSTANTSALPPSCLTIMGPYLSVPSTCLGVGSKYIFQLSVQEQGGQGGSARVRLQFDSQAYR